MYKRQQIDNVVLDALKNGSSPSDIMAMAAEAQISEEQVQDSFESFKGNPALANASFLPMLNQFLVPQKEVEKSQDIKFSSVPGTWDPLHDMPSAVTLEERNQKVQKRFEKWQKSPKKLRLIFGALVALALVVYLPLSLIPGMRALIIATVFNHENSYGLLILPALPAIAYYWYVKKTQIDIIKKLVADKYGWKYDPTDQKNRWNKALNIMPELFNKGNHAQRIEDQFWGDYQGMPFWSGVFHYERESGSGKNRRNTKYDTHFFCVKIPKALQNRFTLLPESMTRKLINNFRKKDIDLESEEFNKAFMTSYKEGKTDRELDITNTLSPSVQVRLLDLKKASGNYSVLLAHDTAVFLFKGRLFNKMHSNFLSKGVFLDTRDQQFLEDKLSTVLGISQELVPYVK